MLQWTLQLEPHSLLNSLTTIVAAIYRHPFLPEPLLRGLSRMLRAATDLRAYASIMQRRFATPES